MPHFLSTNLQQDRRTCSCCFIYYVVFLMLLSVSKPVFSADESPSDEPILIKGLRAASFGKILTYQFLVAGRRILFLSN